MKIFIFLLSFTFVYSNVFAGALEAGAKSVEKFFGVGGEQCPECPKCPDKFYKLKDVRRSPFEAEVGVSGFITPAGGAPQFRTDSFRITLAHNFSRVLKVYATYDALNVDKIKYENSAYDEKWRYQTISGGIGFYVHPLIEIFAGAGKSLPDNSDGTEELEVSMEYGAKVYLPIKSLGYRVVFGLVSREAKIADEGADIKKSQADGSVNIIFVGLSLPLGW